MPIFVGTNLFELYKMCDKNFDRKTLINIFTGIAHEIEYISSKSVVHSDIKPENICWGRYENSKLADIKNTFPIDFGLSYDFTYKIGRNYSDKYFNRAGTYEFMSINTHKKTKPNVLDDLESLIYTILSLSDKPLHWHNLDVNNFQRNEALLKMKENFDIISHCGKKYDFLSKIYLYIKMVKTKNMI